MEVLPGRGESPAPDVAAAVLTTGAGVGGGGIVVLVLLVTDTVLVLSTAAAADTGADGALDLVRVAIAEGCTTCCLGPRGGAAALGRLVLLPPASLAGGVE